MTREELSDYLENKPLDIRKNFLLEVLECFSEDEKSILHKKLIEEVLDEMAEK